MEENKLIRLHSLEVSQYKQELLDIIGKTDSFDRLYFQSTSDVKNIIDEVINELKGDSVNNSRVAKLGCLKNDEYMDKYNLVSQIIKENRDYFIFLGQNNELEPNESYHIELGQEFLRNYFFVLNSELISKIEHETSNGTKNELQGEKSIEDIKNLYKKGDVAAFLLNEKGSFICKKSNFILETGSSVPVDSYNVKIDNVIHNISEGIIICKGTILGKAKIGASPYTTGYYHNLYK